MAKFIEFGIGELKCDACGYLEPLTGPPDESVVGRECPCCGANMLTDQDLRSALAVLDLAELLNAVAGDLPEGGERARIGINPHGDTLTIERRGRA